VNLVSAPALVNIDPYVAQIKILIQGISMANTEAVKARASLAQCKRKVGQNIHLIKEARPNNWIQIVKAECGLGRRSAYNYLAIYEGKSVEQHHAENRRRVAKHRALVMHKNAAWQERIDKLTVQIDRLKAENAELQNEKALRAENAKLHVTLKKIGETLGVAVGLTGHFEHNRDEIIRKLNEAKNAANVAVANSTSTALSNRKTTLDRSLFVKAMSAPTGSVH
jgi:hypothetical protein